MRTSGLTDDLIRISVGLEDIKDIKNDFKQALRAASKIVAPQGGTV
jgi:O-acetylhomoserine (thiol)-lyase